MIIDEVTQQAILHELSSGLDICEEPYAKLAKKFDISEQQLLDFVSTSLEKGLIKRLGVVVNHHKVGYVANAMVVWDVADDLVEQMGELLGKQSKVTLCYQRPRRLPDWPYNLFTMVHGKQREAVIAEIDRIVRDNRLDNVPREILFSTRKFKQTGAHYRDRKNNVE